MFLKQTGIGDVFGEIIDFKRVVGHFDRFLIVFFDVVFVALIDEHNEEYQ